MHRRFQEIVPLNTSTMLGAVDTEQAARRWEAAIRSRLDEAAAHLDPRSTLSFSAADLASADDPQSSSRSTKSFPRNSSTSSPQRSIPATVAATGTATATATAVAGASAAGLGSADGDDAWKGRGAGDARPRLEVPQYEFEEDLDQVPLTPMGVGACPCLPSHCHPVHRSLIEEPYRKWPLVYRIAFLVFLPSDMKALLRKRMEKM